MAVSTLAAGTAIRVWAAFDDFWFDEVWSLFQVADISHPSEVFTSLHLDNNHYLVSLWMYVCGSQVNWFVYRIPSLIAGIGTVVLAGRCAQRWGVIESQAAIVLTSASYVLIVYASEARGYALAGFFALTAFLGLDHFLERRKMWAAMVFSLAVPLGFLSHLTFSHFYLGAIVWSIVRTASRKSTVWQAIGALASCHLLPLTFLAVLYFVDLRFMVIGGGPPYSLFDVLTETLAITVGGLSVEVLVGMAALLAACAGVSALMLLWKARSDLWVFFATAIIGSPVLLLVGHRPEYLHVRYFYINIVLFLVLCSYLLGRVYRSSKVGPAAFAAALALYIAGNTSNAYDFVRFGRGQYLSAVKYMGRHSAGTVIDVASDHDFRNELLLRYYATYLPSGHRLQYHLQSEVQAKPPEWVVLHSQAAHYVPPRAIAYSKQSYTLSRVFPFAGLSGFHWAIYHRADAQQERAR